MPYYIALMLYNIQLCILYSYTYYTAMQLGNFTYTLEGHAIFNMLHTLYVAY